MTHGMVRQLGVPDECDIRVGARVRGNVRASVGVECNYTNRGVHTVRVREKVRVSFMVKVSQYFGFCVWIIDNI